MKNTTIVHIEVTKPENFDEGCKILAGASEAVLHIFALKVGATKCIHFAPEDVHSRRQYRSETRVRRDL
jgi:hypothetical protein